MVKLVDDNHRWRWQINNKDPVIIETICWSQKNAIKLIAMNRSLYKIYNDVQNWIDAVNVDMSAGLNVWTQCSRSDGSDKESKNVCN